MKNILTQIYLRYYLRDADYVFTVGKECPLVQIPKPKSKTLHRFLTDVAKFNICNLFRKSRDKPPTIKVEDVFNLIPNVNECTIRKCIKNFGYLLKKIIGTVGLLRKQLNFRIMKNFMTL